MSAIPCASVNLKTMADGTLRISFDIEPMHAQDAFKLFAAPGTPAAIAALAVGYAAVVNESLTPEKPKGGALAKLAGMWCADFEFWEWMRCTGLFVNCANHAALEIRRICGVHSRADLDHDPIAAEKFHTLIRGPYQKHLITRGIVV